MEFSPFKLLYGPRDVLRETWEGMGKSSESVASHILTMWDRMDATKELVRENLEKAQHVQKKWYDQNGAEGWL